MDEELIEEISTAIAERIFQEEGVYVLESKEIYDIIISMIGKRMGIK